MRYRFHVTNDSVRRRKHLINFGRFSTNLQSNHIGYKAKMSSRITRAYFNTTEFHKKGEKGLGIAPVVSSFFSLTPRLLHSRKNDKMQ